MESKLFNEMIKHLTIEQKEELKTILFDYSQKSSKQFLQEYHSSVHQ